MVIPLCALTINKTAEETSLSFHIAFLLSDGCRMYLSGYLGNLCTFVPKDTQLLPPQPLHQVNITLVPYLPPPLISTPVMIMYVHTYPTSGKL